MDLHALYQKYVRQGQEPAEEEELLALIRKAEQDWHSAEARFNHAVDPDLVDYTIYDIMAARSKYMYLLKSAREKSRTGS